MAMLAEPRRRKRYNLCPRGKALYEDDSRFGTKMLEKMGWEKGKGLGAKEDGTVDFVRVRFKNDPEGLGYEARDDQWTTHEDGFNGLLKSLNGDTIENEQNDGASDVEMPSVGFGFKVNAKEKEVKKLKENISGVSLEEKSKLSKARVHYKKFTRGKDLAQYSEKDLANIFGKKITETKNEEDKPVVVEKSDEKSVEPEMNGNVFHNSNGLSVADYFKQKMEAIKNKKINNNIVDRNSQDVVVDEPLKSKKKKNKEAEKINESESNYGQTEPTKLAKRKKSQPLDATIIDNDDLTETEPKKKKKEKRKDRVEPEEVSLGSSIKKKKEKRKDTKPDADEIINIAVQNKNEKKQKKFKLEATTTTTAEQIQTECNEIIIEQPLKKKKSKKLSDPPVENAPKSLMLNDNSAVIEIHSRKKKKSSKQYSEKLSATTTSLDPLSDCNDKTEKKKKSSQREPLSDQAMSDASPSVDDVLRKKKVKVSEDNNKAYHKLLNLEQLEKKLESYNIFTISSFCAERFHNLNMNAFKNSTLAQLQGYGCNDSIKLCIKEKKDDAERIMNLWNGKQSKYEVKSNKKRRIKSLKRRSVFSGI